MESNRSLSARRWTAVASVVLAAGAVLVAVIASGAASAQTQTVPRQHLTTDDLGHGGRRPDAHCKLGRLDGLAASQLRVPVASLRRERRGLQRRHG